VLQTRDNRAMILAAGLGSRLRPLTDHTPKALLEWKGKPLLEHVIRKLIGEGFREIIINVHHFKELIVDYIERNDRFGIRIEFSHEEELLDTGGGIARASWFFGDRPFLVHSVDIISDIRLGRLMEAHERDRPLATLAVKDRHTTRSLLMNREGLLKGWRDNQSGETILTGEEGEVLTPIAFSAIQVMDPAIVEHFPGEKRFALIPFYLELSREHPVLLHRHDSDSWKDMGRHESYR